MSTASDDPLIGEDIAGYRIVGVIGEGGMGRVYKAVLPLIGARVAIKVLSREVGGDAEMAERFIAEARIANLVRHDGLVNVIGLGTVADGRPYQMMELLSGASLADLIARGPLPLGSVIDALCEALRALAALHARGIIHRDLKPSNLFITTAGHVKLIDFGIAKVLSKRGLTQTGQTLGTPAYMAPEQLAGDAVDARSDLYSIGAVLFEAATGRRLFEQRAFDEAPSARPPATALAPGLDDVIGRAMDPDPGKRFHDAAEMERALAAVARTLPPAMFRSMLDGELAGDEPAPTTPTVQMARFRPDATRIELDKLGRYEVRGVVGQGGAGVVMEGFDPLVQRKVALKVLHTRKRSDHLVREAQAMAKVAHPNLVTLYELGDDAGRVFLAMEYVAGTNLAVWLGTARPWRDVVAAFIDAGRGLAAAHAGGIVHGDFKPANVLIDTEGRVRVGDFGVAEVGVTPRENTAVAGTPAYMAPERLEGANDARSDQFAFCASLWEALHGRLPFAGDTAIALARSARAGEIQPATNAEVPTAFSGVLRRGLAAKPEQRFPSMTELLAALERAIRRRSLRWPWLAAGAALVAAGTVAAIFPWSHAEPQPRGDELAEARAAKDPAEVLRALARVSPAVLAGDDARRLAAAAAVAGPARKIVESAPVSAVAFSTDARRLAVAIRGAVAVYPVDGGAPVRLNVPGDIAQVRVGFDRVTALVHDGIVEVPLGGGPTRYLARCPNAGEPGWPFVASDDLRFLVCGGQVMDTSTNRMSHIDGAAFMMSRTGGRVLAVGDGVQVYDATTGALIGRHDMSRRSTSTGNEAVVAIVTGASVTVWDPVTGSEHTFTAPFEINMVTLTPGPDPQLMLVSASGEAGLWSATGDRRARVLLSGVPLTADVAADPELDRIIVGYPDAVEIKDLAANRDLRLEVTPSAVAMSRDASLIAVAHGTIVSVWYPDLRAPRPIAMDSIGLLAAIPSEDNRRLAYPSQGHLVVEDLLDGKAQMVVGIVGPQRTVFSHDAKRIAFVDAQNRVWTWEAAAPYPVPNAIGKLAGPVVKLAIIDGDRAVAIGHDNRIALVAKGEVTAPCGAGAGLAVVGSVAVVNDHDTISVCDVLHGTIHRLYSARMPHVSVSFDESRVVAVDDQQHVRLFRTSDGGEERLPELAKVVSAIPDRTASRIVAAIDEGPVVVLDRATGQQIVLGESRRGFGSRLSADGSQVIAEVDRHIRLWNVAEPQHPREIGSVGALPMGRLAVAPDMVLTLTSAIDRHTGPRAVCDVWPVDQPPPATITEWIRRIAP